MHVIDDDPSIRRALTRLLQARGYAVHSYESAEAFLARRAIGPGCVVLDLQLPERSGLELLEQLTVSDPELSVVILSGHAEHWRNLAQPRRFAKLIEQFRLQSRVPLQQVQHVIETLRITAVDPAGCEPFDSLPEQRFHMLPERRESICRASDTCHSAHPVNNVHGFEV